MIKNVKVIQIHQPFLKILAQYYFDRFKNLKPDFSRTLIIFPSERNKFYFRRYLLEEAETNAIIPPVMLTIEELIDYIYERLGGCRARILHNIERNFILKKTIDELKIELWQDLPFLRFISIGDRLLGFFDELTKEQKDIRDIERVSKELHFSERYVKDELPILKEVYQRYRKNLIDAGYLDEIDKVEKIYKDYVYKDKNLEIFADFEAIIIAGIVAPTTFEMLIIKKMLIELPAELILHSGGIKELSESDDVHKRYFLQNKLLKFLNIDIKDVDIITQKSFSNPVIHINPFETITKQAFYLARFVLDAIKRYKEPHRIGIVLTDESLIFPITEMLKYYEIEYNLSAGLPLSNQVFYSFLNHLYGTVASNNHHSEFFVFLQHPLVKNASIDNTSLRPLVYKLRNEMIKEKYSHFNKKFFEGNSDFASLLDFLEKCFTTVQQNLPFDEYITNLHNLLSEVLSFNNEIIKKNLPGIKEFFDELDFLARLRIGDIGFNSGIDILEFVLNVLKDSQYHIEGNPLKGIQIIGILEARNLDFDCIIIPSMNEGIFPRRSEKDMFINPALRKEVGLVTKQERENLYYYYFTQLISGKTEVFLSYVAEEKSDIPSRFIMMLESEGYKKDEKPITFSRSVIKIPKHSIKKNKNMVASLQKICNKGLSPTMLKTYKTCPYQFYLKYLLGIKEPDVITEEFDARIWGSIFHYVASEFYKKYFPGGFNKEQKNKALKKFEELFNQTIDSRKYIAGPPKSVTYFDRELYKIYIKNFIEKEPERFDQGFKILTEYCENNIKDIIEIGNKKITLKGYVDRIDINNGAYYIIDYKTGELPKKRAYEIGEDFVEFQLPLYALMFTKDGDKKIGGLIYYSISKVVQAKEIYGSGELMDYLKRFKEEILIPTINEMLDKDIQFYQTENKDNCRYCQYINLCSRREYEGD